MTDLVRDLPTWQRLAAQAASASPVPSPCANVCRIDAAANLCTGCARSIDEIAGWSRMDDVAKRQIWAALPERAATLTPDAPAAAPRQA